MQRAYKQKSFEQGSHENTLENKNFPIRHLYMFVIKIGL